MPDLSPAAFPMAAAGRRMAMETSFQHHLLVAMPDAGREDAAFNRSVIYVCAHGAEGAMGIVLNQTIPDIAFGELLDQLQIPRSLTERPVHFGGPIDMSRGFVLHSNDFMREDTVRLTDSLSLTGTVDILRAICEERGPDRALFALGYAGWGPGQLEAEIQANTWLTVPADEDVIFHPDLPHKWEMALARLGVSTLTLSRQAGHA